MKLVILLISAQLFCNSIFTQQKFVITGTVPAAYDGADVSIKGLDNRTFEEVRAVAHNRKFTLSGIIENDYEKVQFSVRTKGPERTIYSSFFIVPGNMQVEIDSFNYEKSISNIRYINIPFREEEKRYQEFVAPSNEASSKAYNFLDNVTKGYLKGYNVDSVKNVYTNLRHEALFAKVNFIKQNRGSYVSLYHFNQELLRSTLIQPDSLLSIYNLFTKDIKQLAFGKKVYESVMRKQALALNQEMPDFSFMTTAGKQIKLSSFRNNKHVLIAFWASWCGPCIRNMPFLKEVENKYKDKGLQMVSVSVDEDVSAWTKGVAKFAMAWLQTLDKPEYIGGISVSELYQIKFIPQYFLLDKKGKLVYQNVLSKDDDDHSILRNKLGKLLD
jgi:thiol-disulfide isomerase/thioredoxin